jgi:hypothetical protein
MPPKSESSTREIAVPDEFIHALTCHRKQQTTDRQRSRDFWKTTDLIFPPPPPDGHLEPTTLLREFHRLCDHADLRRVRL